MRPEDVGAENDDITRWRCDEFGCTRPLIQLSGFFDMLTGSCRVPKPVPSDREAQGVQWQGKREEQIWTILALDVKRVDDEEMGEGKVDAKCNSTGRSGKSVDHQKKKKYIRI
jgi:hypothetical protein